VLCIVPSTVCCIMCTVRAKYTVHNIQTSRRGEDRTKLAKRSRSSMLAKWACLVQEGLQILVCEAGLEEAAYIVYCVLCTVLEYFVLYTACCTCILYAVYCELCIVCHILYTVNCILSTVYCALCTPSSTVYCILYLVYCALHARSIQHTMYKQAVVGGTVLSFLKCQKYESGKGERPHCGKHFKIWFSKLASRSLRILGTANRVLLTVYCIPYTVYCILCTVNCALYIVYCAVRTISSAV
jgi:hypothetical protein